MNISIKNYTEIASLLPHDCLYIDYHGAYSMVKVIVVEGDWDITEPLDLDEIEYLFPEYNPSDNDEDLPLFILVTGNMRANNIYNAEIDVSCGLVVLGNLTAKNIVVGGQQIYVAGDLNVSGLYWGDYNHGELRVKGEINIRVFLETDYGYDIRRFREGEGVNIRYALYDDDEEGFETGDMLRALFKQEFVATPDETEDIWSWKSRINEENLFPALKNGEEILVSEAQAEINFENIEKAKFKIFPDNKISAENLFRFTYPPYFSLVCKGEEIKRYQMWEDNDIFYRIKFNPESGVQSVYFQNNEEYAVFVALENGVLDICSWDLKSKDCPALTAQSDPEKYQFLQEQWTYWQERYTAIIEQRLKYLKAVDKEGFEAILHNDKLHKIYNEQKNENGLAPLGRDKFGIFGDRITIAELLDYDDEDKPIFRFYYFEWNDEAGCVVLLGADDDGEEYEVNFGNVPRYKNAAIYFNKVAKIGN